MVEWCFVCVLVCFGVCGVIGLLAMLVQNDVVCGIVSITAVV